MPNTANSFPNVHPSIEIINSPDGPVVNPKGGRLHVLFRSALGLSMPEGFTSKLGSNTEVILDLSVCGRFVVVAGRNLEGNYQDARHPVSGATLGVYGLERPAVAQGTYYLSSYDWLVGRTGPQSVRSTERRDIAEYVFLLRPDFWQAPAAVEGSPEDVMGVLLSNSPSLVGSVRPNEIIGFPFPRRRSWSVPSSFSTRGFSSEHALRFASEQLKKRFQSENGLTKSGINRKLREVQASVDAFSALMDDPKVQFVNFLGYNEGVSRETGVLGSILHKSLFKDLIGSQEGAGKYLAVVPSGSVLVAFGNLYGSQIIPTVEVVPFSQDRTRITPIRGREAGRPNLTVSRESRAGYTEVPCDVGYTIDSVVYLECAFNLYEGLNPSRILSNPAPSSRSSAVRAVRDIFLERNLHSKHTLSVILSRPIVDPEGHPGQIGFYMAAADIGKKVTWTRAGRYLSRITGGDAAWGGQSGLQKAALELETTLKPPVLHIAKTQEDCVTVYIHGPSSCMSSTKAMVGNQHPACVYGGDADLTVAYIGDIKNAKARCVVWPDKKHYGRIYGDVERMQAALEAAGFTEDDSFYGATLNLVPVVGRSDRIMMPYWDGDDDVYVDGGTLRVGRGDVAVERDSTSGHVYLSRFTCDACGKGVDEDDVCTVADGGQVCRYCLSNAYTYVASLDEYYPDEDVVYAVDIGEAVLDTDPALFTCEHRGWECAGEQYSVVVTMDGDTETWCENAASSDATIAEDGEWVSDDIIVEYNKRLEDPEAQTTPRCPNTPDMFAEVAA